MPHGEKVCIVTVGGSGVGAHLIRRILQAWPAAKARIPEMRMIVVAGPRIDPNALNAPAGVEVGSLRAGPRSSSRRLRPGLVQGGLTTCMELTAAGTPFIYFPLRNHFEQNFHVAHRLDRYRAGHRMEFSNSSPEMIAEKMVEALHAPARFEPVERGAAKRAASMIAELL